MGNAFEGLSMEEARAKAAALREAEPAEEEMEGGYTPREFRFLRGSVSWKEIDAIDIPVFAINFIDEDSFAVTWEAALGIVSHLEKIDGVDVWPKNDDEVIIHDTRKGGFGWNAIEKDPDCAPAVILSGFGFEVVP